jgi:hypothetical protein
VNPERLDEFAFEHRKAGGSEVTPIIGRVHLAAEVNMPAVS